MKILLAVDGSPISTHAAKHVVKLARQMGEPAEAIVRHAKTGRFDLIVMGTHGRGPLQALLLGSVAGKVIAHGDTPVTVVH